MLFPEMLLSPTLAFPAPSIINNDKNRPARCAEVCAVCGDFSTGYHYEVPSCNGCKTFFRRTIVSERVFKCHKNGNCLFNKDIRCACRSCRFKKCLEVGMNPKAIQCSRQPMVPLTYGNTQSNGEIVATSTVTVQGTQVSADTNRKRAYDISSLLGIDEPSCSGESSQNDGLSKQTSEVTDSDSRSGYCSSAGSPRPPKVTKHVEIEQLVTSLLVYEGRADFLRNSDFEPSISLLDTLTKPCGLDDISKYSTRPLAVSHPSDYWFDLEITICVEYAKAYDIFKNLSIADKCVVINETSLAISLLSMSYASYRNGLKAVTLVDGTLAQIGEINSEYFTTHLLEPLSRINIDQIGFALLKSIIFLHAESNGLSEEGRKSIVCHREKYCDALNKHIFVKYGTKGPAKMCEYLALAWKLFNVSSKIRNNMKSRNNLYRQVVDTCAVWRQ